MNLHGYLTAIKNKRSLNFQRFISLLPAEYKHDHQSIFHSNKTSTTKNSYQVTIIDNERFQQLYAQFLPNNNRVEAASTGDSHKCKVSISFLLVYHQALLSNKLAQSKKNQPEAIVIDDLSVQQSFVAKKNLLIIENQENFFFYLEFLPILKQYCSVAIDPELTNFDIVFGAGNTITDSKNILFLQQYQHIFCSFDYDLGGLTMFNTLKSRFDNTEKTDFKQVNVKSGIAKPDSFTPALTFVLPNNTYLADEDFIEKHFNKTPELAKKWQQAITLAEQLGFTALAQAFSKSKRFMEQEAFFIIDQPAPKLRAKLTTSPNNMTSKIDNPKEIT